jgi:2-polyprenyl-3-methyl-5-hydroxy-6-metoxy-1,4-benzoquinol methylase
LEIEIAVEQAVIREDVESAIKTRGADVYARFLLRHIRPEMAVLDCGCGEGTITLGLAGALA